MKAAGLVDTLKGEGPFTVFAPTDEAFKKLPDGTVEGLLKDPAKLKEILLYHVVAGKVMAADAAKLTSADTVLGKQIAVKVVDGKIMINDATVATADVAASNGVIHVIDTVLLPPRQVEPDRRSQARPRKRESSLHKRAANNGPRVVPFALGCTDVRLIPPSCIPVALYYYSSCTT